MSDADPRIPHGEHASTPPRQTDASSSSSHPCGHALPQYSLLLAYQDATGLLRTALAIMKVMSVTQDLAAAHAYRARTEGAVSLRTVHKELGEMYVAMFDDHGLRATLQPHS